MFFYDLFAFLQRIGLKKMFLVILKVLTNELLNILSSCTLLICFWIAACLIDMLSLCNRYIFITLRDVLCSVLKISLGAGWWNVVTN